MSYTKTNWINGTTPINETNLNKIEQQLYDNDIQTETNTSDITDLKEKNFIVAYMSGNYTVKANDTSEVLPMKKIFVGNGTKLSVGSEGVVIGSGVKHVKVSGQVYFFTGTTNTRVGVSICKNNTTSNWLQHNHYIDAQYVHISLPSTIIEVSEGDVIRLYYGSKAGDVIHSTSNGTYLCVEVVD